MNLLSTKWMPDPPALQKAIAEGYVKVSDGPQGRVYVISRICPNPEQVRRSIALRNALEVALAVAVSSGAVVAFAWLAHWSNTIQEN